MRNLNAEMALAVKDRKYGGMGRGGVTACSMAEDEDASEACATCSLTSPIFPTNDIQHNGPPRDQLWNIVMACHLSIDTF